MVSKRTLGWIGGLLAIVGASYGGCQGYHGYMREVIDHPLSYNGKEPIRFNRQMVEWTAYPVNRSEFGITKSSVTRSGLHTIEYTVKKDNVSTGLKAVIIYDIYTHTVTGATGFNSAELRAKDVQELLAQLYNKLTDGIQKNKKEWVKQLTGD